MLLDHVHYEYCARQAGEVGDRTQVLLQFLALTYDLQFLALRDVVERTVVHHLVDLAHFLHSLTDGGEIGEHTTCPTLGDVRHAYFLSVLCDNFLCLLLRTNEQHLAATAYDTLQRLSCFFYLQHGLVQVDDVNAIALHVDVGSHSGIPLTFEVAKMCTSLQELIKISSHFVLMNNDLLLLKIPFILGSPFTRIVHYYYICAHAYAFWLPKQSCGSPRGSPHDLDWFCSAD